MTTFCDWAAKLQIDPEDPNVHLQRAFLKIAAMALPNLHRRTVAMLKCVWPMPIFLLLSY